MTTITTLPDAPSRTDPATFSTKSDALLGALATFVSETNTVAGECVTNAATATTKAGEAVISAAAAAASAVTANTKAGEASVSASAASGSAGTANTKAGEASASAIAAAASAVTANTKAGEAAASVASIAGGPVASVNGRTGVVTGVQDTLVSGSSIKTVNSTSLLGSGNLAVGDVTTSGTQTLTNKTIALGSNTVSGTIAQFNAAVTDADFATGGGTATGTNTGDNAPNTLYSALVSNATHTGDATGSTALTVVKINGVLMSGLATGLLKNTTTTGAPSIATAETDYVTPTGSGTLTNKTIALGSNTVSGTIAQFNTAVTDADLAILGANTFTAAQIYSDQLVSRAMFKDCGLTVVDKGNSSTTTQTYDYTAGSVQTSTATGNHTIAFSNFPPTGNLGQVLVILTNGGAFTLTWPGSVLWVKPDGTTTASISTYLAANTGRTALQTSGVDQLLFWTRDAGSVVYGKLV